MVGFEIGMSKHFRFGSSAHESPEWVSNLQHISLLNSMLKSEPRGTLIIYNPDLLLNWSVFDSVRRSSTEAD